MMKKILCCFLIILMLTSLAACSQSKPEPVPMQTESTESTNDNNSSTEENLVFSKDGYEQSVQHYNPEDLNWTAYGSPPSSIDLSCADFMTDTIFWFQTPHWTKYVFDTTTVLTDSPSLIMYTFGIEGKDYKEITIKNSVQIKDLVDWKEESKEEFVTNGQTFEISTGKCYLNNNARNEKLYAMILLDNVDCKGCIIGITEKNAFHTLDDMKDVLQRMIESITVVDEPEDLE